MVNRREYSGPRYDDNALGAPGKDDFQAAVGLAPDDLPRHYGQTTVAEPLKIGDEEPTLRNQAGRRRFPASVTNVAGLVALGLGLYMAADYGGDKQERILAEEAAERAEAQAEAKIAENFRRLKLTEAFLAKKVEASSGEEKTQAEQELAAWRERYPELTSLTAGL